MQLELQAKQKEQDLKKLKRIFNQSYLDSKLFWKNNLESSMDEEDFNALTVKFVLNWFKRQGLRSPDGDQARCIANAFDDIQVIARAGSGKTSTIINRASFLVKHCGVSSSEILILAFNRDAANEVNARLKKVLGDARPQAMTFHALAYALVHPEEELIFDDEKSGFSKSKTIQKVIDSYLKAPHRYDKIREFMLRYFRSDWEKIEKGGYNLSPEEMVDYRRSIPYLGLDGRYYKSHGEKSLADFLFEYDISYKYEKNYIWNGINYKPDFTIPLNNPNLKGIIIEYFGITGDESYDKQTMQKRCYWNNKSDYLYIELFPNQLLTEDSLYEILSIQISS